ncbi:hypothetical protein [uncultured Pontibacter sp.]|uniref:hypothetical protein n=1 Tax=uncultured Pontibacter sp. TaxID=453356 RepID=UPI00260B4148|nr:hypothetical protein [uncultured Pontibacter sp.]
MENRMNYPKAILFLVSGIVAIVASFLLGAESKAYGFLVGYGYSALPVGLAVIFFNYFKEQKLKKQKEIL